MKKIAFTLLLSLGLTFSVVGCNPSNGGNQGGDQGDGKILSSIEVSHNPTKDSYTVGEQFSKAGLEVKAVYSDESKEVVSNYTLNPADGYTFVETDVGTKVFTVTYEQKTASFSVSVAKSGGGGGQDTVKTVEIVLNDFFPDLGPNESAELGTKEKEGITVTAAKGTGVNDPKFYHNEGSLRTYPGNKITVSATDITKIEITECSDYGTKTKAQLTANKGKFNENVWGGKEDSVTFEVDDSGQQFRITKLTVTLGGDPYDPGGEDVGTGWSQKIKNALTRVVGEEIPYIELPNPQVEEEEDEDGPYVYIYDEDSGDVVDNYLAILDADKDYEYVDQEEDEDYNYVCYFYAKELEPLEGEGSRAIMLQVDYFPGNSSYDPCFEIYAWLSVSLPTIEEWSDDDYDLMMEYLGEEMPFVEGLFTTEDYWEWNDDEGYLSLISSLDEDGVEAYIEELEKTFTPVEDNEGYYIKAAEAEGYNLVAYVEYGLVWADDYSDCWYQATIFAHLMMIPVPSETWPADVIAEFLGDGVTTVPSFDGLSSYAYTDDDYIAISLGSLTDGLIEAYINKLVAANYSVQYIDLTEYGYTAGEYYQSISWVEDVQVYLDNSYGDGDWTLYIYQCTKSYEKIVENFPLTEVLAVLGEGVDSVPQFVSSVGYKIVETDTSKIALEGIVGDDYATTFVGLLEGAGYDVNEDDGSYVAKNEDELVEIDFYFVGNYLEIEYKAEKAAPSASVIDVLDQAAFGLTDGSTSYGPHYSTDMNGGYYAYCASAHGIQIRSKTQGGGCSGILGLCEGKTCVYITIEFDENTQADKYIDIYASNDEFETDDMYGNTMTPVGAIQNAEDSYSYVFEGEFEYIGLRSRDGAVYLTSVTIGWN